MDAGSMGSPMQLGSGVEMAMEEFAEDSSRSSSPQQQCSGKLQDQIRELERSHTKLELEMNKILEQRRAAVEALKRHQEGGSSSSGSGGVLKRSLSTSPPPVKSQLLLQQQQQGGEQSRLGPGPRRTFSEKLTEQDLGHLADGLTLADDPYVGILQSMGQAVYMFTTSAEVTYWNRMAERLYGWTAEEAVGRNIMELLVDQSSMESARKIVGRLCVGESWVGQFMLKKKSGEIFPAMITNTPFLDNQGKLVGVIGVSSDARPFIKAATEAAGVRQSNQVKAPAEWHQQQPWQIPFASTISSLANRILSHLRGNLVEVGGASGGSSGADTSTQAGRGMRSGSWTGRLWLWSAGEAEARQTNHDRLDQNDASHAQNLEYNVQSSMSSTASMTSTASTSSSSRGHNLDELDENDISLDSLMLHEPIGKGSCATVYRGTWRELDVAVKVFHELQYNDCGLEDFRKEVAIMRKLRHPNIVLFLGAACVPERVCIVTELMPRGSLFKLLQRKPSGLDWKRKLNMALDVARGMTYLHNCSPIIVHRDLKSTNLLVDRNLKVKVCDFSLSKLKHSNFLTGNARMGTSQWMPPEILRSEASNEKSDVYSFGVILWELATEEVPWKDSEPLQVIARVGFKDERLEIPENLDPQFKATIRDCWKSAWEERPSFEELTIRLKEMLISSTREHS